MTIIDCDVHNSALLGDELQRYLPQRWRAHNEAVGARQRLGGRPPRPVPKAHRCDAWPPSGALPGADLEFTRRQLLDEWNVEYAIVNNLTRAGDQINLDYGTALATAVNDWLEEEWLAREARLRASIVLQYEDAESAAEEIERRADHPGFVQVLLLARTLEPLGSRRYWKIYEAATRRDLKVAIHYGGRGVGSMAGPGRTLFYVEECAAMAQAFQAQVASLVFEGVFERFPTLEVVLIEGGIAWLPSLMWRLDATWDRLKGEVPRLSRPPSEYVREHFWVTTQPMEEPPRAEYFDQMLKHMDMNDRILFASDYPHWDFDSPSHALPSHTDDGLRRMIMSENARSLYGFPVSESAGHGSPPAAPT